jgi:hypothetical protein
MMGTMAGKKQSEYAAVAMSPRVRAAVKRLAKKEGRKLARQAAVLIELGLAEYERQNARKEEAARV